MIHTVSADRESFRPVHFEPGLNIVLADRRGGSTEKDTRNGVGKSALIDIVHYCLGSRSPCPKIESPALAGWTFRLDLTLGADRGTVSRSVAEPELITVGGDLLRLLPELDLRPSPADEETVPISIWKRALGRALFDLPDDPPGADPARGSTPSFRRLVSYLARRRPGAYLDAMTSSPRQSASDRNIAISHLLGLDSTVAARWAALRTRESDLRTAGPVEENGLTGPSSRPTEELETRRRQIEQEVGASASALDTFQVHPRYGPLLKEANDLTLTLQELADLNFADGLRLTRYRESIVEEKPPEALSLERVYAEAGVVFPEGVRRTLEEAREFHRRRVLDRREFLAPTMAELERTVRQRKEKIRELSEARDSIMAVLESRGALDEYARLHERRVALREELEAVRREIAERNAKEERKREIAEERSLLERLARQDCEERRPVREAAIRWFHENSRALYRSPGDLVIDANSNGYEYGAAIERGAGDGIERMQIFCFDLAVLQLQRYLERGMDFLIHDSLLFDPVDARQRARALERAHEVTTEMGAQYICTLNSDMVPEGDFSPDFDYRRFVRLRLSDESPEGRLLGIHY